MKYSITMERTLSLAIHFDANSDDEAYVKAEGIAKKTTASEFEEGSEQRDYSLCDADAGRTLVNWR